MSEMRENKRALVIGMALSGIGAAKLLSKHGYEVIINDVKPSIPELEAKLEGVNYINRLGVDPMELINDVDLIVLSPVIPNFKPFAIQAAENGVDVTGEIEIGYRYSNKEAKFAGISGTNGKTTSTTLLGEMAKATGNKTFVLGNIGIPLTEYADEIKKGDYVVIEVAALQLESIKTFRMNVAGMINISEDHINRFGSMEAYIASKERIFKFQTEEDYAVLNYDDEVVRKMADLTKGTVVYFSQKENIAYGACVREDGMMVWHENGNEIEFVNTNELIIPGKHNVENALCCCAMAVCMGIGFEAIRDTLRKFKGVEHRIEFVRELNGIQYYNDSKGTNPDSTIRAIEAMSRPTILLLGVGEYDKQSDFTPLFRAFGDTVKGVVASGINVPAIMAAANRTGFRNIVEEKGSFEEMIKRAANMAKEGYNVLLSPAAASWGQFANYEERGRIFKDIVNKLV